MNRKILFNHFGWGLSLSILFLQTIAWAEGPAGEVASDTRTLQLEAPSVLKVPCSDDALIGGNCRASLRQCHGIGRAQIIKEQPNAKAKKKVSGANSKTTIDDIITSGVINTTLDELSSLDKKDKGYFDTMIAAMDQGIQIDFDKSNEKKIVGGLISAPCRPGPNGKNVTRVKKGKGFKACKGQYMHVDHEGVVAGKGKGGIEAGYVWEIRREHLICALNQVKAEITAGHLNITPPLKEEKPMTETGLTLRQQLAFDIQGLYTDSLEMQRNLANDITAKNVCSLKDTKGMSFCFVAKENTEYSKDLESRRMHACYGEAARIATEKAFTHLAVLEVLARWIKNTPEAGQLDQVISSAISGPIEEKVKPKCIVSLNPEKCADGKLPGAYKAELRKAAKSLMKETMRNPACTKPTGASIPSSSALILLLTFIGTLRTRRRALIPALTVTAALTMGGCSGGGGGGGNTNIRNFSKTQDSCIGGDQNIITGKLAKTCCNGKGGIADDYEKLDQCPKPLFKAFVHPSAQAAADVKAARAAIDLARGLENGNTASDANPNIKQAAAIARNGQAVNMDTSDSTPPEEGFETGGENTTNPTPFGKLSADKAKVGFQNAGSGESGGGSGSGGFGEFSGGGNSPANALKSASTANEASASSGGIDPNSMYNNAGGGGGGGKKEKKEDLFGSLFGGGNGGAGADRNPASQAFGGVDGTDVQAMASEDPGDYFGRIDMKFSLFQVVEKRYRAKAMTWASTDATRTLAPARLPAAQKK